MSGDSNRGKHIIIFNVWMKQQHQAQVGNRQISNSISEISYINKQGDIESLRCIICGGEFESMIHVMKYRRKKLSYMMQQLMELVVMKKRYLSHKIEFI